MNQTTCDMVKTHAAKASRRASLLAIGGAALGATLARPATAKAAKPGKKSCKKTTQKACDRCASDERTTCEARLREAEETCLVQIRQAVANQDRATRESQLIACQKVVAERCLNETNPEQCQIAVSSCCTPFGEGDAGPAVDCLLVALLKL